MCVPLVSACLGGTGVLLLLLRLIDVLWKNLQALHLQLQHHRQKTEQTQ